MRALTQLLNIPSTGLLAIDLFLTMSQSAGSSDAYDLVKEIHAQANTLPKENAQGYSILDTHLGSRRPLKVIIIGFGASAIQLSHVLAERDPRSNINLQCYEKNPEIGGTWYENT